jgi:hypothetical protein
VNCLVDILSSATSTVTVLMDEFDAAEGKRIFSQMLTGELFELFLVRMCALSLAEFGLHNSMLCTVPQILNLLYVTCCREISIIN